MLENCETASRFGQVRHPAGAEYPLNSDDDRSGPRPETSLPRVIVVDDEHLIADTVAQILNVHGFDAFCVYSGEEALHLAKRFRPDYLLADVMMPKLNGIDLAIAMETIFPSLKVLLFSGQTEVTAAMQRQKASGSRFAVVAKPIHPEKLVQKLRSLQAQG